MVGGGGRKEHGLPAISSSNIFAALESRRRKSSSKKRLDKSDSKGNEANNKNNGDIKQQAEVPAHFWAPSLVSVKSWADVEDDDDYYKTTAPPPPSWSCDQPTEFVEANKDGASQGEETDCDEDAEDEAEEDFEEDADVQVADSASVEPISLFPAAPSTPVVHEPARQLSKKELKKKELAELDAVLAELGLSKKSEDGNDALLIKEKQSEVNTDENGEVEYKGNSHVLTESKSSKRRKAKKEKSFKEGKDGEIPISGNMETETKDEENGLENDVTTAPADPKEVLKKLAPLKKKRSMKDSDAAAKAVAAEASARAAKLAAAKKKEKNHYNQQPVR